MPSQRQEADENHTTFSVLRDFSLVRQQPQVFATVQTDYVKETGRTALNVFKYGFHIDGDIYFIAHDDSAAIHRILPTDSKVLSIDLSGR